MTEYGAFGASSRYYAAANECPSVVMPDGAPLFDSLRGAHDQVTAALSDQERLLVKNALGKWNQRIRGLLRSETGFLFSTEDSQTSIPARLADGLPLPFADVLRDVPDPLLWWATLHKQELLDMVDGLDVLLGRFDALAAAGWLGENARSDHPWTARGYAKAILDKLEASGLEKKIFDICEDVLGAYFFHRGRIEIYWMAIALFARMRRLQIEHLTVVVLIHELAHAYSHAAFDLNGRTWATKDFATADLGIIEGIAQYYTHELSHILRDRAEPGILGAYESLLACQSGPYLVHLEWLKTGRGLGEAMRSCLVQCRLQRLHALAEFGTMLEAERTRLAG